MDGLRGRGAGRSTIEPGTERSRRGLHLGLTGAAAVVPALAVTLPWLQVAGEPRNGLSAAELLVDLGSADSLGGLRWAGIAWYLGAFAALAAWAVHVVATAALPSTRGGRIAVVLSFIATVSWGLFVAWAGSDTRVLLRWPGPAVGLIGLSVLCIVSCLGSLRNARAPRSSRPPEGLRSRVADSRLGGE